MKYGQFCPIAKATEILGERWTILVLRELLLGGRRFNELQRGLGDISPALLTSRLKSLEEQGLVARRRISGQRGYEYLPTRGLRGIFSRHPVARRMGLVVGAAHAGRGRLRRRLPDVLPGAERRPEQLPGDETVIRFQFTDLTEQRNWWLLVCDEEVQICINPPPRDVDVYFTTTVGPCTTCGWATAAIARRFRPDDLVVEGEPALTRNVSTWLRPSVFVAAERQPIPQFAAVGQRR